MMGFEYRGRLLLDVTCRRVCDKERLATARYADGTIEINHPVMATLLSDSIFKFKNSLLFFCICRYMKPRYPKEQHRGIYPLVQSEK